MKTPEPGTLVKFLCDGPLWGIPYWDKVPGLPVSLSDGVVVGCPTAAETERHFPEDLPKFVEIQGYGSETAWTVNLEAETDQVVAWRPDVYEYCGNYGGARRVGGPLLPSFDANPRVGSQRRRGEFRVSHSGDRPCDLP